MIKFLDYSSTISHFVSVLRNKKYNAQCRLNWSQIIVRKSQADWTTLSGDIGKSWQGMFHQEEVVLLPK